MQASLIPEPSSYLRHHVYLSLEAAAMRPCEYGSLQPTASHSGSASVGSASPWPVPNYAMCTPGHSWNQCLGVTDNGFEGVKTSKIHFLDT